MIDLGGFYSQEIVAYFYFPITTVTLDKISSKFRKLGLSFHKLRIGRLFYWSYLVVPRSGQFFTLSYSFHSVDQYTES